MAPESSRLAVRSFALSVRLNSLFFPFSVEEIKNATQRLGFTLARGLENARVPAGTRLAVSGEVATKSESSIILAVDSERSAISIQGRNIAEVLNEFEQFKSWSAGEGLVDLESSVRFYELLFEGTLAVAPVGNPLNAIRSLYGESQLLARCSEIVGSDLTNYGVRLVNKGSNPATENWMDIQIFPATERPTAAYSVTVVLRSPRYEEVVRMANDLPDKMERIVSAIGGDGR